MGQKKTLSVPTLAQQIELDWTEELATYCGCAPDEVAKKMREWFPLPTGTIRIKLMDESFVEFRWAFFIVSESRRAIAVFTEHCGHHLFPYHDARVYQDGALVYEQMPTSLS